MRDRNDAATRKGMAPLKGLASVLALVVGFLLLLSGITFLVYFIMR